MQKIVFFCNRLHLLFELTLSAHTHAANTAHTQGFGNYAKSAAGYTRPEILFTISARFYLFNLYFAVNSLAIGGKGKKNSLSQAFNHVQTRKFMEIDAYILWNEFWLLQKWNRFDGGELVSRMFEYFINRLNVCTFHVTWNEIFIISSAFRIWLGTMKPIHTLLSKNHIIHSDPEILHIWYIWNETSESYSIPN